MPLRIAGASSADAEYLTGIAIAAKSHWGYPEDWIRRWVAVLTVTPDYIAANPTFVAFADEERVGFCALQIRGSEALLDHLWVAPAAMRRGIGRALFKHAESVARQSGATHLSIIGDPHAEGFYRRMGAIAYGLQPAFMDGKERYLPLLTKPL